MTQHTQPHTLLSAAAVAPLCTSVSSASAIGTAPGEQQHGSIPQHSAELSSWEQSRDAAKAQTPAGAARGAQQPLSYSPPSPQLQRGMSAGFLPSDLHGVQ